MPRDAVFARYRMAVSGRRVSGGRKRAKGDPGKGTIWPGTGNVQNLPRPNPQHPHTLGWRECIIPRPGFLFAVADFGGLELATIGECATHAFGFSRLAEIIREGRDAHAIMAASLAGCRPEAMEYALAGHAGKEAKGAAKAFRQTAKPANFGLPGGMGVKRFVSMCWDEHGLRITEEEAWRIKRAWQATWPEMLLWLELAGRKADYQEPVVVLGTGMVRNTQAFCEIANTPFQALGAVIATDAWIAVQRECEIGRMQGAHVVLFAHDELVTEVPESRAEEYARIQSEIMEDASKARLTYTHTKAEPMLMRRWQKGAEYRLTKEGALYVW